MKIGQLGVPDYPALGDPVMGPARESVVSDGRSKRHCGAVESKGPTVRSQWMHDLLATTAHAQMRSHPIRDRDVQRVMIQLLRDLIYELVVRMRGGSHLSLTRQSVKGHVQTLVTMFPRVVVDPRMFLPPENGQGCVQCIQFGDLNVVDIWIIR